MSNFLCDFTDPANPSVEEMIPKKVRFRDNEEEKSNDMVIELPLDRPTSWKDMLVILIQSMDNTVILKLLGCNIGFSVLQNKIYSMWRLSAPIHMMDIENGYFLVKFQNKMDWEKALFKGSWTIFGQYLTVQPWTMAFDPTQEYPSVVMAWIRFPALPSYLYNHKIITEIGELVGKVVKLDMNTDSRTRGHFARMVVYFNLEKPLVSQIFINGRKQQVEYESLSSICFHCGRYEHVENTCNFKSTEPMVEGNRVRLRQNRSFKNRTLKDRRRKMVTTDHE
ncbi:hypothetical protein J1N35_017979 [Gossypium stocksii]|uniref:DUF4283 domain-containing protein n=1 Tax=Gossypium stocksii TaxID=47602 RepID=A0A9D3VP88_9ROSI|nr:hypothetical protein J1N35_017979 [Gossypium stocksii]